MCTPALRADCLEPKVTSDRELSIYSVGYPPVSRHSSNVVSQEFVLSSSIASPLIKPRRVARGKMGILKGFHRLAVSFDV